MVALAADRYARAGSRPAAGKRGVTADDLSRFVVPVVPESAPARLALSIPGDPLATSAFAVPAEARDIGGALARPARSRLTAILVADNSRVAVIDDATVAVGDYLADGSRVSAIQPDHVVLVDRNGQIRLLNLTSSRQ